MSGAGQPVINGARTPDQDIDFCGFSAHVPSGVRSNDGISTLIFLLYTKSISASKCSRSNKLGLSP